MDATWMAEALAEARKAAAEGEVPIGAVVVLETVGPIRGVLPTRRFLPALTKRSRPARGRAMHRPRRNSDVDVLVEFEPGHVPGFALVNLEDELSALVGRKVDLHTPGSLSKYFRDRVVREAQDQYVRA